MTPSSTQSSTAFFANSYQQARQHWLKETDRQSLALQKNGWETLKSSSIPHSHLGPNQAELSTDLFWLAKGKAKQVAVIISATHGIEGYVGNAGQRFLLDYLAKEGSLAPKDTAFLFVHAINPWGMAWFCRCDEKGIDLNRNYVDFNALPDSSDYQSLQHCFWISDSAKRQKALQEQTQLLGQKQYEVAISGGQYTDPFGPFYGGKQPSHGQQVCQKIIKDFALDEKTLIVIDIHSGLGSWAYGELICDHPLDTHLASPNDNFAQHVFGPGVTNPARGNSSSVAKFGLQDYFWHRLMGPKGCYLTLEFGSYSTQALFDVIISDHRLWKDFLQASDRVLSSETLPEEIIQQQQAMLEHFCPQDPYWRQLVLFQTGQTGERLLHYFRNTCGD